MGNDPSQYLVAEWDNPKEQRRLVTGAKKATDVFCFISKRWWDRWFDYTSDNNVPRPGPIDNSDLVVFGSVLRADLQKDVDYLCISPDQWNLLHSWYGGGQKIARFTRCIYEPPLTRKTEVKKWLKVLINDGYRREDIADASVAHFRVQYAQMAETGIERPLRFVTTEQIEQWISHKVTTKNVKTYDLALFYIAYLTEEQMDEWFEQKPSIEFIEHVVDAERPLTDLMVDWLQSTGYKPFWKWFIGKVKQDTVWTRMVETYDPHLFDDYPLREAARQGNAIAVEALLADSRVNGNNDKAWKIALAKQDDAILSLLNDWSPPAPVPLIDQYEPSAPPLLDEPPPTYQK
jgi:hypothetical protein